jgi:hypothetical protein
MTKNRSFFVLFSQCWHSVLVWKNPHRSAKTRNKSETIRTVRWGESFKMCSFVKWNRKYTSHTHAHCCFVHEKNSKGERCEVTIFWYYNSGSGLNYSPLFHSIEWQMLYSCLGETTFKINSPLFFWNYPLWNLKAQSSVWDQIIITVKFLE